jgi:hypothetical protein
MGNHESISHDTFPKPGRNLGKEVRVCFHYDLNNIVTGAIVRDDGEDPYITIIGLDNGRYVLGTECQFNIPSP